MKRNGLRGRLQCNFCGEATREHDLSSGQDLSWLTGLYLAHLVESHWEEMNRAREIRMTQGPVNDAWTRL